MIFEEINITFKLILIVSSLSLYVSSGTPSGALISTSFTGRVGYSLDDIPSYALDQSVNFIMNNVSEDQWKTRAEMQVFATIYRQVFRVFNYYPKLQLTLPPQNLWEFTFMSGPYEATFQGHTHIVRNYSFYSVLLGTANSINASEPLLLPIGGVFTETFMVPVDPEHVFQRSGYACADESTFSLGFD